MARPTDYNEELLEKAKRYLLSIDKDSKQCPTVEGLAKYIGISRQTVYVWAEEKPEFSDILQEVQEAQAEMLIQNGLTNQYNSTMAKMMLSKHGYVEKTEREDTVTHNLDEVTGKILGKVYGGD